MSFEEKFKYGFKKSDIPEIIQRLATDTMPAHPKVYGDAPILRILPKLVPQLDDTLGVKLFKYILSGPDTSRIDYCELVAIIGQRFELTEPFTGMELAELYYAADCEECFELMEYLRPRVDFMDLLAIKYDNWCCAEGRTTLKCYTAAVDRMWDEVMDGLTDKQKTLRAKWDVAKNRNLGLNDLGLAFEEIIGF